MDENAKASDLEEQATITRQPWGPALGPGARTSLAPLGESCEPAYDELDLLWGKAAGHRWDGQVERVKEWRSGIVAAAGPLAAIAEEVALAGQDLETRYRAGSSSDGRMAGEAANRHGGRGVVAG